MSKPRLIKLSACLLALVIAFVSASPPLLHAAEASTTLVVGVPGLAGSFLPGFSEEVGDAWAQSLIHGYETYAVTPAGKLVLNATVVRDLFVVLEPEGHKTYTFVIHDDLKWSNGTPITARDYVLSLLWQASPHWKQAGGQSRLGEGLVGYQAYHAGQTPMFAGVKLMGSYRFSLTIDAGSLPYYWEQALLRFKPLPADIWARTVNLESGNDGSKLVASDLPTIAANLSAAYGRIPSIVSGPYKFMSFLDGEVTLAINENFKGDYLGRKPDIDFIMLKAIAPALAADQVIRGAMHLVPALTDVPGITRALSTPAVKVSSYYQNGIEGLFLHCDFSPADNANFRQALAHMLDRNKIVATVLGGHGVVVNGYYSPAQSLYSDNSAALAALPELRPDMALANQLLDKTDWIYESNGTTRFNPAKANSSGTYLRYNSRGEKLTFNHFGLQGDPTAAAVIAQLRSAMPLAGIEFRSQLGDLATLTRLFYKVHEQIPGQRNLHGFNLGVDFGPTFDPYPNLHSDGYGTELNPVQLRDPAMDRAIRDMRRVRPSQETEFSSAWVLFQQMFRDLLPVIPLYAKKQHDIASSRLSGLAATGYASWADMVCQLKLEAPLPLYMVIGQSGYKIGTATKPMAASYYKGRDTMMPVRLLEEFGMEMAWDQATATATLKYRGNTIELTIGSTYALVNGLRSSIIGASGEMIAPELAPGRTMIPLRFVSENLGFKVHWDPSNTVTIWP